jgi:signal transduction histidine kinase/ActR/RegA family two-component response regulator
LAVFAIAAGALIVTYQAAHDLLLSNIKSRLMDLAVVTAAELNSDLHSRITASSQMGSKDYRRAAEPLLRLRKSVPEIYYAYTLRSHQNHLYFVLDSSFYIRNQGDDTHVASTGQRYVEAPPAAFLTARTGRPTVSATPYTDEWGTFLSGFAPIRAPDGRSIDLVGVDLSLATLNRQLLPLRLTLALSLAGSGLLSGLVGILVWRSQRRREQAIDEISRARDLARQAAANSDAANRAKSTFLATMGHEIRTPLNGVIGLTNILLSTNLTSEQTACLRTVKNSGESLLLLLNQLLDFAAIESGSLVVDPAPVCLRPLIEEVLALVAMVAESKGVHTTFELSSGVPEVVLTDPSHLRQILLNLVGNAIKFTPSGEVALTVSAQAPQPDGRLPLVFKVRDSGPGLSESQKQDLFQPFTQGDPSTTRVNGGLGLGLAISQGLVTALGGTIQAETEPGVGTTLLVVIPVELPAEPGTTFLPAGAAESDGTDAFAVRHPLRILLAEDNPVNVRVCELMLRRLGYSLSVASDGEEALRQQRSLDPDLVLMDLRMPKIDGLEATRRIRVACGSAHRPWIVAITANVRESDREAALNSGMNDFISKPIQVERLRSVLLRAHGAIQGGSILRHRPIAP